MFCCDSTECCQEVQLRGSAQQEATALAVLGTVHGLLYMWSCMLRVCSNMSITFLTVISGIQVQYSGKVLVHGAVWGC